MERINAECGIRAIFSDGILDPFCTVARNQLDAFLLFRCQFLEEALKYFLAVSLGRPNYVIGIMVDYNSDILVAFLIGSLVDPDFSQMSIPG